jgi:hypothetical protein
MSRWAAVMIWILAGYFAYVGAALAFVMLRSLFSGPWLGLEPEIMIPLAIFAIAAGLVWLGRVVWRREPRPTEG